MATVCRSRKSTVAQYLRLAPQQQGFPTQPASYLITGPVTSGQRAMLLCRADALLPRTGSAAGPCPHCAGAAPLPVQHACSVGLWALGRLPG